MMEIHKSARKHGINDDDIRHAIRNAIVDLMLDAPNRNRQLLLGPTRSGTIVEVIVLHHEQGPLVIHAMPVRTSTRKTLRQRRLI